MSELDEKQYTSGRCFLKLNDNVTTVTTPVSISQNSMYHFKNIILIN